MYWRHTNSFISPPGSDSFRSRHILLAFTQYYFFTLHDLWAPLADQLNNPGPKFWGPKICKIWHNFGWLKTSTANISRTDEENSKLDKYLIERSSSHIRRKSLVNIGPVTTDIWRSNHTHPNRFFQKTKFWRLRVLHPQIFTCAGEWPSLTGAPPLWMGVPFTIFLQRGVQNWLKFQQVRVYNLGGSGSSLTILCHVTYL